MTNEQMDTLIEAELIMGEIDYDLDRWRRELDQYEYWLRVNEASMKLPTWDEFSEMYKEKFDWEKMKELEPRVLPLAWYSDGTRFEIGTANIDPETGLVTARISDSYWSSYFAPFGKGDFSIKPSVDITDPNYPEYRYVSRPAVRTDSFVEHTRGERVSWDESKPVEDRASEAYEYFSRPLSRALATGKFTWRWKRGDS